MSFRAIILLFMTIVLVAAFAVAEESPSLTFQQRDPSFSLADERLKIQERLIEEQNQPYLKKGLLRSLSVGGSWIPEGDDNGMGLAEFRTSVTLACPAPKFAPFTNSFFLLTPNFTYTNVLWKGADCFPKNLYGAGISVTWMKPINDRWNLMVNAGPSYSADGKASSETVRCTAMFGATWTPNKKWKVLLGVVYLNRSDIPVLPFGGFTYMPNDDWKVEFMMPQPRVARRIYSAPNSRMERWAYLGVGFGGGTWAIDSCGVDDLAMYREYSAVLGYESNNKFRSFQWNAEIAFLFGREMQFDHKSQPNIKLDNAFALRLKCSL